MSPICLRLPTQNRLDPDGLGGPGYFGSGLFLRPKGFGGCRHLKLLIVLPVCELQIPKLLWLGIKRKGNVKGLTKEGLIENASRFVAKRREIWLVFYREVLRGDESIFAVAKDRCKREERGSKCFFLREGQRRIFTDQGMGKGIVFAAVLFVAQAALSAFFFATVRRMSAICLILHVAARVRSMEYCAQGQRAAIAEVYPQAAFYRENEHEHGQASC